jgi:nucleoid-associated protein YgaU
MTRETKIGLLVGLAFIIVIGILLSDHMTSTTQPPQAALAEAAPNVRESVAAPASNNPAPPVAQTAPPAISPSNTVLTQQEIRTPLTQQPARPAAPAVTQVEVGGPAGQAPGTIAIRQTSPPAVIPAGQPPVEVAAGPTPPVESPLDPNTAIEQWATDRQPPVTTGTPVRTPAESAKREYVAQAGDSLSKMASRLLGSNSKANREAIIKLNPSLQKNPELVVEGRKYTIPQAPAAAAAPAEPQQPQQVAQAPQPAPTRGGLESIPETVPVNRGAVPVTDLVDLLPTPAQPQSPGGWYTVKDNDNLWKIAAAQLGSGNAWTQLKELNKDILKGGDTVQRGMRLRLPTKPLASAN